MNGSEWLLLVASIIIILGLGIILVWKMLHTKKLSPGQKKKMRESLGQIQSLSCRDQIIKYDILLDDLLTQLHYKGSLGEKLKKNPSILDGNINTIWRLHKLRNTLVHTLAPQSEVLLQKEARVYHKLLVSVLDAL